MQRRHGKLLLSCSGDGTIHLAPSHISSLSELDLKKLFVDPVSKLRRELLDKLCGVLDRLLVHKESFWQNNTEGGRASNSSGTQSGFEAPPGP